MNLKADLKSTTGPWYPGALLPRLANKPAVVMADSGHSMSYSELDAFANRLGRLFQWIGLKTGQHVLYLCENRLECLALQWGAHYVGLYYSFLDPALSAADLRVAIAACDARAVVVSGRVDPETLAALRALPAAPKIYGLDAIAGLRLLREEMVAFEDGPLKDTCQGRELHYMPAKAGAPRGRKPALDGRPLGSSDAEARVLTRRFGVSEESVYLLTTPVHESAPINWCCGLTLLGGTVIMLSDFHPVAALDAIASHRVSHGRWLPGMLQELAALPAEIRERYQIRSQKVAVCATASCPDSIKEIVTEWWGPILCEDLSAGDGREVVAICG